MQLRPPRRPHLFVEHLLIQHLPKPITPPPCPIRPDAQPAVGNHVLLRRQGVTDRLDLHHRHLEARRHGGDRKRLAHHTGRLQHPPRFGCERLNTAQ